MSLRDCLFFLPLQFYPATNCKKRKKKKPSHCLPRSEPEEIVVSGLHAQGNETDLPFIRATKIFTSVSKGKKKFCRHFSLSNNLEKLRLWQCQIPASWLDPHASEHIFKKTIFCLLLWPTLILTSVFCKTTCRTTFHCSLKASLKLCSLSCILSHNA